MDLKKLKATEPWDWPEEAADTLLRLLRDETADRSERLLAAELAGDFSVVHDELARTLLSIVAAGREPAPLRARAAISLGPALECADTDGFDDLDDVPISEEVFLEIVRGLAAVYRDADAPDEVRRRVLEASVRAPQDWHPEAVLAAYSSGDPAWKLTAVFCMRFVPGLDPQILEALESGDRDLHYQAVRAAGSREVQEAWEHVAGIVTRGGGDKALLLAAIEAAASIRPEDAPAILGDLTDHGDEDIVEAAFEAIAMAEGRLDLDDEDADDEEEEENG